MRLASRLDNLGTETAFAVAAAAAASAISCEPAGWNGTCPVLPT